MKINFRQGIISHQSGGFLQITGNNVNILAANRSVTVSVAQQFTNYTHSEDNSVSAAWTLSGSPTNEFLYWDFNQLTFERTFGSTPLEPVAQSVPPGAGDSPIVGVQTGAAGIGGLPGIGNFVVEGQYVLGTNKPFEVTGSTGNNGSYKVASVSYNTLTGNTTITPFEAVVDTTVDGSLALDLDFNNNPLYVDGRHWYDTANNIHYVLDGNIWTEVLRVFAAQIQNSTIIISMGQNTGDFTGTQIGNNNFVASGRVLFAESGNVIRRDGGTFFTTEDQFFTNQSRVDGLRLESNVTRAQSIGGAALNAFSVVAWVDDGIVRSATYDDTGNTVLGLLTEPLTTNQVGAVIVQGTVTNPAWTWTTGGNAVPVGSTLWAKDGDLVSVDPNAEDPINNPVKRVPVARVLSGDTVIFEQGLGGVGPAGVAGSGTGTSNPATASNLGVVTLVTPSSDAARAWVISDTDSRLTDARSPLPHVHQAVEVTFTPGGGIVSTDVQGGMLELGLNKLNLTGGTMTGGLILNANPTAAKGAATKQYVDALAAGIDAKDSVHVATLVDIGGTYSAVGGTAGTGGFTGVDLTAIDGLINDDYDIVLNERILIKNQSDAKQNGIYIVTVLGSPPTDATLERAPDHDGIPLAEISEGNFTFIIDGASQQGSGWSILGGTSSGVNGTIILNFDDMNWGQVSSSTSFSAGTNIDIDISNNISVIQASAGGTVDALTWNGNSILSPPWASSGQPLINNGVSWTNAAFSLPIGTGSVGDFLQSDGSGATTWTPTAGYVTNPMSEDLDTDGFSIITSTYSSKPITLQTYGSYAFPGGKINILAGNNFDLNGTAGSIDIFAGNDQYGTTNGTAGSVNIKSGLSDNASGHSGNIVLTASASNYGYGGSVTISAGNTGYGSGASGGNLSLTAGDGYYGGHVSITPGAGSGGTDSYYQGALFVKGSGGTGTGRIRIASSLSASYAVELTAPAIGTNTNFTFPPDNGTPGQVLQTDGFGITTWQTATGGVTNPLTANLDTAGFNLFTVDNTTLDGAVNTIGLAAGSDTSTGSFNVYGGNVSLTAGNSTSNIGGSIYLTPGNGVQLPSSATGPSVVIGPEGYSPYKAYFTMTTTDLSITTKSVEGSTQSITIKPGDALTTGYGGDVNITAGSGTPSAGLAGSIFLTAGTSGAEFGPPAVVEVRSNGVGPGKGAYLKINQPDNAYGVFITTSLGAYQNVFFDLPYNSPNSGNVLFNDGSGNSYWGAPSGGNNWIQANNGNDFSPGPVGTGGNAIAIGRNAKATFTSAIAMSNFAYATNNHTIALGDSAKATGAGCISIGRRATAAGAVGIAVGYDSKANGNMDIAIGRNNSTGTDATSIGRNIVIGAYANLSTTAAFQRSISIGDGTTIGNNTAHSVVVGSRSTSDFTDQVVIGSLLLTGDVTNDVPYSVKIGSKNATNKNLLHLFSKGKLELYGDEAQFVLPNYTTAEIAVPLPGLSGGMVFDSDTSELKINDGVNWNVVGGGGASNNWIQANNDNDFSIGPNSGAFGNNNIALGYNARALGGVGSISIGTDTKSYGPSTSISFGYKAFAYGIAGIAIGADPTAQGHLDICIGRSATTRTGTKNILIGAYADLGGTYDSSNNILIGTRTKAGQSTQRNILIGENVEIVGTYTDQVMIGSGVTTGAVPVDVNYSVKLGYAGVTVAEKNLLHLFSKGKLELYGDEAQFIFPNYNSLGTPVLPATTIEGGAVWDTGTKDLRIFDGTAWNAIGGGGVTNPLTADLITAGFSIVTDPTSTLSVTDSLTIKTGNNTTTINGSTGAIAIQTGTGQNGNGSGDLFINTGATNSSGNAGSFRIAGGDASGVYGNGGLLDLRGGDAGDVSGAAGGIILRAGNIPNTAGNGTGALFKINGGRSYNGQAGEIRITAGKAYGSGVGGDINLVGGESVSGFSGNINITPGGGAGYEGSFNIHSGFGKIGTGSIKIWKDTDTSHTTGNYISIFAPAGLNTNNHIVLPVLQGSSGEVLARTGSQDTAWVTVVKSPLESDLITAGFNITTANSAIAQPDTIKIIAGESTNSSYNSGAIEITGGVGTNAQYGGSVTISGGNTVATGSGGNVLIKGGNDNSAGGLVTIRNGTNTASIALQNDPSIDIVGDVNVTGYVKSHISINAQIGTTYPLVITDDGKLVTMNNGGINTVTIPLNTTVAYKIGTQILVSQEGTGQTTIAPEGAVVIHSAGGLLNLASQYTTITLIKKATDTWLIVGDLV